MRLVPLIIFAGLVLNLLSCNDNKSPTQATRTAADSVATAPDSLLRIPDFFSAELRELSDADYPDNPDIPLRHSRHGDFNYDRIAFRQTDANAFSFDIRLLPEQATSDTIVFGSIDLREMLPFIPEYVREDDYLSYITVVNQEWNRQQVRFRPEQFKQIGDKQLFTRVDIARNCLESYLWEVIAYAEEDGREKPVYHAWFDFPNDAYAALFSKRNGIRFDKYRNSLEQWQDPEQKNVNLQVLRRTVSEDTARFRSLNNKLYPKTSERAKKEPNIIYPKNAQSINAFLSDSTKYATFSPPGYYNTADPRRTYLMRLAEPAQVVYRKITSAADGKTYDELEVRYEDPYSDSFYIGTRLIVSGFDIDSLPQLPVAEHHKGFQTSMGIANHSFYESYDDMLANPSARNPFFALLLNGAGEFLDSHKIGIDGPLMHRDADDPHKLHLWVLSFERHSFVGHYVIDLKSLNN